jgi:hypothetical protein
MTPLAWMANLVIWLVTGLVQGIPSTPTARLAVQRSRDPVRASLQKVVIMADERFPENDGRWISFPAHGTTRMPFTYALTKLRLSNFGTVPGKKLITPYIAARGISTSAEW